MKQLLKGFVLFLVISMTGSAYAGTTVYFSPNGGCQEAIIAAIGKAHKTIDVAMFAFTSREVAKALLSAKERQVKIKIVLDTSEIKDHYSKSKYLITKGFDVKFHMGPALMHDKFAVIDDRVVLTGSYNWTVSADKKNDENLLVITDRSLAGKYAKEFKHLWGQSGEGQLKDINSAENKS